MRMQVLPLLCLDLFCIASGVFAKQHGEESVRGIQGGLTQQEQLIILGLFFFVLTP